jgi:hypothetical protein
VGRAAFRGGWAVRVRDQRDRTLARRRVGSRGDAERLVPEVVALLAAGGLESACALRGLVPTRRGGPALSPG